MSFLFNLLGIGRMIRSGIANAFTWATANASRMLAIALACSLAWGWLGWHKAAKWERVAQSTFAAQKTAGEAQAAVNREPAVKSAAIARKSNDEAPAYYEAARRAAAAHSVRLRDTACATSPANMPGADTPVESIHGPAPVAPMVCRPFVEDNQIIGAAARAAEMHQEALDLIAEGVAVAGD